MAQLHDGRQIAGEKEYAEEAKSYFHGEISVVLGIPAHFFFTSICITALLSTAAYG